MAYLTREALESMGFQSLGQNVKISDKASIYEASKMSIGDHTRIDDFCVISGAVTLGKYVHIAPLCLVAGGELGVEMQDFSGLAYHVQVFSQSDDYSGATLTNPTVPDQYKREHKAKVTLGRHVIVGSGSVVFPGVHLADGCSVGALALVTKSTEPWGVYAGNPARRIKDRKQDLLQLEQRLLSEQSK